MAAIPSIIASALPSSPPTLATPPMSLPTPTPQFVPVPASSPPHPPPQPQIQPKPFRSSPPPSPTTSRPPQDDVLKRTTKTDDGIRKKKTHHHFKTLKGATVVPPPPLSKYKRPPPIVPNRPGDRYPLGIPYRPSSIFSINCLGDVVLERIVHRTVRPQSLVIAFQSMSKKVRGVVVFLKTSAWNGVIHVT